MTTTLQSRNTRSKTWPNAIFPSKISQGVGRDVNPGLRGDKPAINRLSLSNVAKVSVHINNTSNIHFLRVYKFSNSPLTWPDGQFMFLQEKMAVYLQNHTQRSYVYVCVEIIQVSFSDEDGDTWQVALCFRISFYVTAAYFKYLHTFASAKHYRQGQGGKHRHTQYARIWPNMFTGYCREPTYCGYYPFTNSSTAAPILHPARVCLPYHCYGRSLQV